MNEFVIQHSALRDLYDKLVAREWCEYWYDNDQKYRVLRGGSWSFLTPQSLLSSYRGHYDPDYRYANNGFRLVLVGALP